MLKLSHSRLTTWLYCRAAYYNRYILGISEYDVNFEFGSKVHREAEAYHLGKDYDAGLLGGYTALKPADHFAEVEREFEVYFKHPTSGLKLPTPFRGIVDGITPDGRLEDLKTAQASWSQKMADSSLQATAYLYWRWQETGELQPFTFTIYRKDWTPKSRFKQVSTLETTRTVDDFVNYYLLLNKCLKDIQAEEQWLCSCPGQDHLIGEPHATI